MRRLLIAIACLPLAARLEAQPHVAGCAVFPANNVWNAPVDTAPVDPNSNTYVATIGAGQPAHPDFGSGLWDGGPIGIPFVDVPGTQAKVKVTFEYDAESDHAGYPVPPNVPIEGGSASAGDRHVLVVDHDNCVLYELYSAYPQPDGSWRAGSGAIFDLKSNALRPAGWTSADAAGLPIFPGLVRYEEVAAGEIRHAIRFTAPRTRQAYIWPARHYASSLTALNYPPMGQRFRLKAGAFYAPISLENRAAGWESPYTLSYSAINTWLGVETRTIGLEGQLDWLGTRTGHVFDLGLTGGVFGWNEGTGVVLAGNGFMLHDRQTPVFGRVGPPGVGVLPFQQFDGRAGVYAGVEGRWLDRVVLRFLRYDNRADATSMDTVSGAIAWNTRFNSAGLRIESGTGWTGIVQWLQGETYIEPAPGLDLAWPFRAQFALLSKRFGRQTLSARYDRFEVDSNVPDGDGRQTGHAWTAAWMFDADAHWRLALEWLQVRSYSYLRTEFGGPPLATETQLQLAVRYAFGSGVR